MAKHKMSKIQKSARLVAVSLLGICAASRADASGFALTDYSMTGLGRAYAGAGVVGDDYSALGYNPAGMSLMKKSGFQAGAALIWQHGDVKGSASKVGAPGGRASGNDDVSIPAVVPNVFAQYHLNDTFDFGFGIYAPFGLASKYDRDWFGSDHGVLSELEVIDIAPALSVRFNEHWTVGASVIARWGRVRMTNTSGGTGFSDFDIDGWDIYGKIGIMYELSKDTRFGLAYQTQSPGNGHKLKGKHDMYGIPGPLGAALNGDWVGGTQTMLPENILFSAFHKEGKFGYSASVRWTKWDRFNNFTLTSSSPMRAVSTPYNWNNTWAFSVGLDYFHSQKWTFRGGLGYDESPVPGAYERTPRIPDNDRYWMSLGATYAVSDNVKLDFGYSHLYLPTYEAHNGRAVKGGVPSNEYVNIKYDVNAEIFGVQFQYSF